jgi:hypothetical protein
LLRLACLGLCRNDVDDAFHVVWSEVCEHFKADHEDTWKRRVDVERGRSSSIISNCLAEYCCRILSTGMMCASRTMA